MKKENFMKMCEYIRMEMTRGSELYKHGLDTIEYDALGASLTELLMKEIFTKDGFEWVQWFLYDKGWATGKMNDLLAQDEHGNLICQTIDDLYDFLKQNKYFRNEDSN